MKVERAIGDIELRGKGKIVKKKTLVDTGASRSIVSKSLAEELDAFVPFEEPYELNTANKGGKLRIVGHCRLGVVFEGAEVPGGSTFEVAGNLREGSDIIIGRPEIDTWDIIFTDEGPRPREVPIEFEII